MTANTMIDANTGMHVLLYVALTLGFGRVCWVLAIRKMKRLLGVPDKEFSEKYKHLDKYL